MKTSVGCEDKAWAVWAYFKHLAFRLFQWLEIEDPSIRPLYFAIVKEIRAIAISIIELFSQSSQIPFAIDLFTFPKMNFSLLQIKPTGSLLKVLCVSKRYKIVSSVCDDKFISYLIM